MAGRLNWSKLSWDFDGNNALGTPGAGEAFSASDIVSAFVSADGTTLTVKLTDTRADAIEGNSLYMGATADKIDMQAGFAVDGAGNVGTSSLNNAELVEGIDLGTYGNLIHPVMVEGRTYYFWDISGDGIANAADEVTIAWVESLAGIGNITESNRTWIMNGVTVRLPTYGSTVDGSAAAIDAGYQSGSAATNTPYFQTTLNSNDASYGNYDDLLAIWDQFNDTPGTGGNGTPPGWSGSDYLSATLVPSSAGQHAVVHMDNGYAVYNTGSFNDNVALEVVL